jgi:hypothetical protein
LPFIGSFFDFQKHVNNPKNHPLVDFCQATYFKDPKNIPSIIGVAGPSRILLMINRPEAAEEIFITKNKYFDKHPKS